MKQVVVPLPANAFLKVIVGTHIRRVYFKDVKKYKKLVKPHLPAIPKFDACDEWNKSTITSCDDETAEDNLMEQKVITFEP
jgi:hypothetical protein